MSFLRLQHIMVDLGTGNNNKINWAMNDKQEFIDIVETVYRGARKGRGLVVSPKGTQQKVFTFSLELIKKKKLSRLNLNLAHAHKLLFLLYFCRLFYKISLLNLHLCSTYTHIDFNFLLYAFN